MSIPNNALVLVTDGEKMLLFRNEGDKNQIDLRTEAHDEADRESRDTAADGSGKTGSGRREADPRQAEEDRFTHDVADTINSMVLAHKFEHLVIVSPPRALGELRKKLHKEAERRVICEIDKEMTGRPIPDIEELIVNSTKAEEPSEV